VRAAPRGLSEIRHLPHLFPQVRGPGLDSRCPQVELVEGTLTKMITDPIADMLTRIRNAVRVERSHVEMPMSKVKRGLAEVLKREGYIWDWGEVTAEPVSRLRIELKYGPNGERVIQSIRRVSKPGRRVYSSARDLKPVLNGLGIQIISTSRGVISDREARQRNLGGEVLCEVW
jgi:small subunit ribosomal protein S8